MSLEQSTDDNVVRGIAAIAVAVFLFSIADASAKWLGSAGFHASQTVFLRYLFGLIPVAIAIRHSGGSSLKTGRPFAHILRALLMCLALLLFFWGLKYLPLAEAIAVAFTAPLFITALSVPVLGEKVGLHRWGAVAVGFLGMLVMLRPGTAAFRIEALLVLASAFTYSLGALYTRRITSTETNTAIFTFTTVIAGLAMMPFAVTTWHHPAPMDLALFLLLGLAGGAAHLLVIVAYRYAPASVNAPIEYTALIWGSLLGWCVDRPPSPDLW